MTELESRFPLNLNVLSAGQVPGVMSLREALLAWLEHRKNVLVRRSNFRLDKIAKRLEVLEGYLKAYLNLDEVIRIIREEDEPKPALIKRFKLTDNQAEAILNMRLRSLRKLEEMEIRGEHKELSAEQKELKALVKSEGKQWERVSDEIRQVKATFGPKTKLGARRTTFSDAPAIDFVPVEAMIEKEPITVICSRKGWIRSVKGHLAADADVKFKEGDGPRFTLHAETTDKILLFATDGRFYTLDAAKLPGGRGHGEPVRLMIDLDESRDIVELFVHQPGRKLLVASHEGNGFIVPEDEVVAMRRAGKQVLNVSGTDEAVACAVVQGDHVAVIGDNRKLLIFPLSEVNEMTRGKGVRLQRYKDGGLGDVKTFTLKQGLVAYDRSDRARTFDGLKDWLGQRAQAGRLPPKGFPVGHKFGGGFGSV
jgi:topoisomerase-4 subunit A